MNTQSYKHPNSPLVDAAVKKVTKFYQAVREIWDNADLPDHVKDELVDMVRRRYHGIT